MKRILNLDLNTQNRIFGLDLLRAIAILFVMFTHAARFLPFPTQYHHYYINMIYDGVGIFFVLSGFLIGGILIREVENSPYFSFKNLLFFWAKRWSRTLPNYYLFLIILMPLYGDSLITIFKHFFFLQNPYHTVDINSIINWTWSLSVEEWFYLIIPFLTFIGVSLIKTKPKIVFLSLILVFLISIGGLRYFAYFNQNLWEEGIKFEDIRYSVIFRVDGIMYGVLGAFINHYYLNFWNKYKWYFFAMGILGIILFYFIKIKDISFYLWVFSFPVTSISILGFLPILSIYKTEKNKIFCNTITYISLISYSLYLVNMPVSNALVDFIDWDYIVEKYIYSWGLAKVICHILFWTISILLSNLIYKYFEIPTITYFRKKLK